MARKAKEEALQKIGNCTKSRPNVSKISTKENANASNNNENRAPLQTQYQSAINSMKNETVSTTPTNANTKTTDSKTIEELVSSPSKPFAAVEKIFKQDKKTDTEHVYDYTFDNDAIPLETEDAMKDVYDRLAKENKIEVKKYRARNVKKQPEKKGAAKKEKTQKRHLVKQPAEIEPPRKKPNLQIKKVNHLNIAPPPATTTTMKTRSTVQIIEKNNNLTGDTGKRAIEKTNTNDLAHEKQSKNVPANEKTGDAFARLRLRNRIQPNSQSTPKTSTPVSVKTVHFSTFDDESPVVISEARKQARPLTKQRLQLSTAEESIEANRTSPVQENDYVQYFDDDDFPMPTVSSNQDKENTLSVPGTSATSSIAIKPNGSDVNSRIFSPTVRRIYGRSPLKNITTEVNNTGVYRDTARPKQQHRDSFGIPVEANSARSSLNSDMSGNSTKTHSATRDKNRIDENEPQPSTSKGFLRSRSNQNSLASNTSTDSPDIQSITRNQKHSFENEPHPSTSKGFTDSSTIFSPTKRRVYGRSPLKNIIIHENNSYATTVFGQSNSSNVNIGAMSTLNSVNNSRSMNASAEPKKTQQLTLPEEMFLSGRRQSPVEINFETSQAINVDDYFGFDDNDDILDEEFATGNVSEKPKAIETEIGSTIELKKIRENLKRFLRCNDSEATATKQSKSSNKSNKTAPRIANNKQKKAKSPTKQNPDTIFADPNAKKQKDIRSALTAQANEKEKSNKSNEIISVQLFEEVEMAPVQHGRKSYSGPVKQYRKRHVSIDSEPEEISDGDDDDFAEKGKKLKAKRRKKVMVDSGPKENVELEEYAKKMNGEFAEIDEFSLPIEMN